MRPQGRRPPAAIGSVAHLHDHTPGGHRRLPCSASRPFGEVRPHAWLTGFGTGGARLARRLPHGGAYPLELRRPVSGRLAKPRFEFVVARRHDDEHHHRRRGDFHRLHPHNETQRMHCKRGANPRCKDLCADRAVRPAARYVLYLAFHRTLPIHLTPRSTHPSTAIRRALSLCRTPLHARPAIQLGNDSNESDKRRSRRARVRPSSRPRG